MKTMREVAKRVLVIFPFEEAIYREAGVPVEFVGHPLVDLASSSQSRADVSHRAGPAGVGADGGHSAGQPAERGGANPARPGRGGDAHPQAAFPASSFSSRAHRISTTILFDVLRDGSCRGRSSSRPTPTPCWLRCDVALTASGTATVQTALHDTPMVIVYRVSPWTYRLGRHLAQCQTLSAW